MTKPKTSTSGQKKSSTGGILVLHGPNLNLLGSREPEIYGYATLAEINQNLLARAKAKHVKLEAFQSNHEGDLIDRVQSARAIGIRFIIINAGGFTHTSVALRDALAAVEIPYIEVHLSNIHRREAFRHHSYFSELAVGVIVGFGPQSYDLALEAALTRLAADD
jgi:3-dehydroquinate dehydratase II